MTAALWTVAGLALLAVALRWLRVAQREHYLAGSALRFARRWWSAGAGNGLLAIVALAGAAAAFRWPGAGVAAAAALLVGPAGLRVRGRTAPLRWTARMRRLAAAVGLLAAAGIIGGVIAERGAVATLLVALGMPILVDLGLMLTRPLEQLLGWRFVRRARAKLEAVSPVVVAITGSYGKTTTKEYVRHLCARRWTVVASPASFNNVMGLARAINEHLTPGTEVFVAEMGTYGPGEIARLCSWIPPKVGVITAVGPVHLERFRSVEAIAHAKAEILERAETAVLNVDDPRLEALAEDAAGRRVIRCSVVREDADVGVLLTGDSLEVRVRGRAVGSTDAGQVFASNLACAVGAAVALGMSGQAVGDALQGLPAPQHRRAVYHSRRGFTVIDDTYNSNPAGARAALETLAKLGTTTGRRVVVTPGMVELGRLQRRENRTFAELAARMATDVVVVGRTNRRSLLRGTEEGMASVIVMGSRDEAVAWVRRTLGRGDVVLYENDLPDHYP